VELKRGNDVKARLLKREILQNVQNCQIVTYRSGWCGNCYYYLNEKGCRDFIEMGLDVPFIKRFFSEETVNPNTLKKEVESLISNYGKEETAVILAVGAGGLLFTPLLDNGFRVNAMFVLDATSRTKEIRKWLQSWKREIYCSLSKKRALAEALCDSKDEVIFLVDEETPYCLKIDTFLKRLVEDGEILLEGEILPLNTVPLLITNRFKVWQNQGLPVLTLPCFDKEEHFLVNKLVTSYFWKLFCNHLCTFYDSWQGSLSLFEIANYEGTQFASVYEWLVAAFSVLQPYLQTIVGEENPNVMTVSDFASWVNNWLQNTEKHGEMDISEEFISQLKHLKKNGTVTFVRPQNYTKISSGNILFAADETFVYIFPDVFNAVVKVLLPGCNAKVVYESLVESDYAKKGDGMHCFPKCSQNAGFLCGRKRMPHIRRELLLTEAEFLLEV
jgi:hypothetical protein